MKVYIQNLIPRVKAYSSSLDKKEIFVDVPWVIIDSEQDQQKYIFKRNGELIMSLNGKVTIGKWEYISSAKSLLIDRVQDKVLLNQNFVDSSVMILKKDGIKEENIMLANEILLPDLNVLAYLQRLFYARNNIKVITLKTGKNLELYNYMGYPTKNKVTIDGEPVEDSLLDLQNGKRAEVKNNLIIRILEKQDYKTDKGIIVIDRQVDSVAEIGDQVYKDDLQAPDGKYKLNFFKSFVVKDGRLIKK